VQQQLEARMSATMNRVIQRRLAEAAQLKAAGNGDWWRLREAVLFAIGTQISLLDDIVSSGVPSGLDTQGMLRDMLENDLEPADVPPFLRGRALWVAAKLGRGLPRGQAAAFLSPVAVGLGSVSPLPVRIGACRAAAQLFKLVPREDSAAHLPRVLAALVDLMRTVDQDVLLLVMETAEVRR
jgi:importin-9